MRPTVLALAVLLALPLAPQAAATHVVVERYSLTVDGETALGWLAYPNGTTAPTTLLVFGHGCCGKPDQSGFVRAYAEAYNVVVVAMDYRGPGGWDVMKGSEDLVAATVDLQARFPIARTILWGISMGGETTGMAVAARPDLYDYWVDTFGVTNLFEEFATLGLYPCGCTTSWMVNEAGGTPLTAPQAYADRSPVLMADQMRGITRAYISHGVGDPIVPYSMSQEMFAGLAAAGVPVTMYTVTTGGGGVQGPWVPVVGFPAAPTPVGPAAHDGRGSAPAYVVVDQLLRGIEPDAGLGPTQHLVDYTVGRSV